MGTGITEFVTKFSTRVNVGPVAMAYGEWLITVATSDATDDDPEEYAGLDLCLEDARDLAIALYNAVCAVEARLAR